MTTGEREPIKRLTKKRLVLSDGKAHSGSKGRMTREMEQKFTSLYGNAVRDASGLAKGIHHFTQTEENYRYSTKSNQIFINFL